MNRSLAECAAGAAWLQQFSQPDRDAARLLLDSLRLVSRGQFLQGLDDCIRAVGDRTSGPLALYVARKMGEGERYFFHGGRRPGRVDLGVSAGEAGSEWEMVFNVTQWTRRDPVRYLDHPPVSTLRSRQCRHIVLLDDLSGSGNTVAQFIRELRRQRKIAAWWSLGWLTFHVVAYAITTEAEDAIRRTVKCRSSRENVNVSFQYCVRPGASQTLWTQAQRLQLERIAGNYGNQHGIPLWARLGYQRGMSVIVFQHGCPNNAPGVLWHGTTTWRALFPNRAIPTDLYPLFGQTGALYQPAALLRSLDAGEVAQGAVFDAAGMFGQRVLLVLAAVRRKHRTLDRLAQVTNLPQGVCQHVVGFCWRHGLIDDDHYLTERGRAELKNAGRLARQWRPPQEKSQAFYFPRTLRRAGQ